jgi:PAS domain S-box-containing protein
MNAREGTAVSPVLCLELPGETAARLRDMRWSGHMLGLPGDWSRELQSALQLLLSSSIPAILFWGEARILFFNDAFAGNLDAETREAALAIPAAQGPLALWRRHWPWIESLFAGSTVRTPRTDEKGGVFAERAEITHVLLGDPANRYARGGLLLMNPAWGKATSAESSVALRHNAVLEAIDEGFCVIEIELDERGGARDYRFLEVNPGFERLTGLADVVGRRMREIAPATEQHWYDRFAEVARTGESVRFENEASQIAGGRWFDVFAFRVDAPEDLHVAILFSDITDRKNAATAAADALAREREANALLDAISDSAPIGLAFLDRDLRFRRINARLAEMNGLPAAAHIGKRADEFLPGVEGLSEIVRRWEGILATGEPWLDVEVLGETPAQPGMTRSWSENFFPVRVDGKIVGIGTVVEDTTERRLAQEALAASEARFRALIELGPVGIALSEQDGRILLANDAFLTMLGYTREELPALNWIERTSPESIHLDWAQIQALRDGKSPVPFEKEYIRRDGTRVAALVVAQFLPGEGERMMAYAIDITDRRAAEKAVRESEARLRHLIDHMAGFVAMLDREGTLLEIGEPALRAGGMKREKVLGRKFWECAWWTHDPEQQKKIEEWFQQACQGATIREDVVARAVNETRLDVDMMLVPVFDWTGEVTHVFPSGVDISERKRIELALRDNEQRLEETAAALKEADRRKDDFLATLAHELRNPLAPIRNGIQILRLVASSHVTLERTTSMMERQMQHLVRLVDDLLDVSRITRGKIELRREVVLVNEIVSSALESCETLFEPHGHTLSVVLESQPLRVRGDPDRLRQVFSNLLSNAAKFTPREGTVWVTLEKSEGHALVKVRDSGIGIPQERLGSIFEMFAQIHAPQGNDGLGIGLALVQQLVNRHGGTVHATSEGLGKGSEFTVSLPLLEPANATSSDSIAATHGNGANGRRILVVDDNLDAAESLASVLSLKGHVVQTAADGAQALASAERDRPDIVLMDLGMPGMDGLTAARLLRAQPGGENIRIIAVTGWGQDDDRERTRAAGIDVHLVKPVNTEVLLEVLERSDTEPPPAGMH